MLYCFLRSQACRLIMAADYASSVAEEKPPERPAPLYVGVAAWASVAPVFAGHLLALLTGTHLSANKTSCDALSVPVSSLVFMGIASITVYAGHLLVQLTGTHISANKASCDALYQ